MSHSSLPQKTKKKETRGEKPASCDVERIDPQEVHEIFEEVKELREEVIQIVEQTIHSPFLPPEVLAEYDRQFPGSAERIMIMSEKEQNHRHTMDLSDANNRTSLVRERSTGQWMGFGIAIVFACLGAFLLVNGFPIQGSILGVGGIAPIIYAFTPKKQ